MNYVYCFFRLQKFAGERISKPWLGIDFILKLTKMYREGLKYLEIIENTANEVREKYTSTLGIDIREKILFKCN